MKGVSYENQKEFENLLLTKRTHSYAANFCMKPKALPILEQDF